MNSHLAIVGFAVFAVSRILCVLLRQAKFEQSRFGGLAALLAQFLAAMALMLITLSVMMPLTFPKDGAFVAFAAAMYGTMLLFLLSLYLRPKILALKMQKESEVSYTQFTVSPGYLNLLLVLAGLIGMLVMLFLRGYMEPDGITAYYCIQFALSLLILAGFWTTLFPRLYVLGDQCTWIPLCLIPKQFDLSEIKQSTMQCEAAPLCRHEKDRVCYWGNIKLIFYDNNGRRLCSFHANAKNVSVLLRALPEKQIVKRTDCIPKEI